MDMCCKLKLYCIYCLWCVLSLTGMVFTMESVITNEEFNATVTSNGYLAPSKNVYRYLANYTKNFSRAELAMLIAQLIHESGGFTFTEQTDCLKGNHCKDMYVDEVSLPNKTYHGRGYIQLTWAANYKLASEELGLGDKLLRKPELLACNQKLAMRVSVWYWNWRVKPALKVKENQFGVTTKAINPEECVRGNRVARRRYSIYLKVAEVLEIAEKAKESGCYN